VDKTVQGAQVVGRVADLLRIVGRADGAGAGLSDIVRGSGLTRPTVHRLLNALAGEGLLDHNPAVGTWHLGPEMYVLGSIAANRYTIEDLARPALQKLADETGESAFLSIRRGDETVCLLRVEGSFPVRSFVLHEGVRFPLGVASAGLAILAFLTDEEVERVLGESETRTERFGPAHSAKDIRAN
jgi:DNA-binding IclR family transcriptional regulator